MNLSNAMEEITLSCFQIIISTLFKNEVGISPSAYIRQKKLEEAYHLVTQHDMPLNEIAELLGFYDASHFSADFKRMYGKSPQHVRSSSFDMAK